MTELKINPLKNAESLAHGLDAADISKLRSATIFWCFKLELRPRTDLSDVAHTGGRWFGVPHCLAPFFIESVSSQTVNTRGRFSQQIKVSERNPTTIPLYERKPDICRTQNLTGSAAVAAWYPQVSYVIRQNVVGLRVSAFSCLRTQCLPLVATIHCHWLPGLQLVQLVETAALAAMVLSYRRRNTIGTPGNGRRKPRRA